MIFTFIYCHQHYQPDLWYINIARIVQLAELFKLQSYQRAVKVISNTVLQTFKTFFFLYWFLMLLVMIFGTIVFALERGEFTVSELYPDGAYLRWNVQRTEKEVSPFISLASSMWYALVSITTVGYGDIVPTSVAGRAVGAILLLLSFVVISLPITVLGEAFATAVDHYNVQKTKMNSKSGEVVKSPLQTKVQELLNATLEGDEDDETFSPIRRSQINRLSRIASTRYFGQDNNNNNNQQSQQNQQQKQQDEDGQLTFQSDQSYNETINKYIDRLNDGEGDQKSKERYEIELELFQTNQKMKEIGEEYYRRMNACFEYQAQLYIKLQKLSDCSNVDSTSPSTINNNNNNTNNNQKHLSINKTGSLRNVFEICDED